jgi:hypothetical protein
VEEPVFIGVLSEISIKAKILRARLKEHPDSVEDVIGRLERLEEDLLRAVCDFGFDEDTY